MGEGLKGNMVALFWEEEHVLNLGLPGITLYLLTFLLYHTFEDHDGSNFSTMIAVVRSRPRDQPLIKHKLTASVHKLICSADEFYVVEKNKVIRDLCSRKANLHLEDGLPKYPHLQDLGRPGHNMLLYKEFLDSVQWLKFDTVFRYQEIYHPMQETCSSIQAATVSISKTLVQHLQALAFPHLVWHS